MHGFVNTWGNASGIEYGLLLPQFERHEHKEHSFLLPNIFLRKLKHTRPFWLCKDAFEPLLFHNIIHGVLKKGFLLLCSFCPTPFPVRKSIDQLFTSSPKTRKTTVVELFPLVKAILSLLNFIQGIFTFVISCVRFVFSIVTLASSPASFGFLGACSKKSTVTFAYFILSHVFSFSP